MAQLDKPFDATLYPPQGIVFEEQDGYVITGTITAHFPDTDGAIRKEIEESQSEWNQLVDQLLLGEGVKRQGDVDVRYAVSVDNSVDCVENEPRKKRGRRPIEKPDEIALMEDGYKKDYALYVYACQERNAKIDAAQAQLNKVLAERRAAIDAWDEKVSVLRSAVLAHKATPKPMPPIKVEQQ
jgi:hypothetical protein